MNVVARLQYIVVAYSQFSSYGTFCSTDSFVATRIVCVLRRMFDLARHTKSCPPNVVMNVVWRACFRIGVDDVGGKEDPLQG